MIDAFITEKMSAYIAGGLAPDAAAHFTRGELVAIYNGRHWSRDMSGAMQVTPPPEALGAKAAMDKAEFLLAVLLTVLKKPPVTKKTETQELSGFEKMEKYARRTHDR